ncbi:MAG: lysine--tRNA ligase, partial [Methanosarcinales archaeon]|nr:lysine--tRNA ligase [Methanosarcinales archaeon]
VKFEVQETLPPDVEKLTPGQRAGLLQIAAGISDDITASDMHDLVYVSSEAAGISGSKMFQAIYIAILGKKSGPRAGYFMASLDRTFLLNRLAEAGRAR